MTPVQSGWGAERSFWSLVAVVFGARFLVMLAACCAGAAIAARLADAGASALWSGAPPLLPGLVFVLVWNAGLVRGGSVFARALWRSLLLYRRIGRHRLPVGARLGGIARQCGLGESVALIGAAAPYAFTYGFAAPRVLVSTGLLRLDDAELMAVLCHEREHVRNRDPLKTLLARTLLALLFFLPYLRHLRHRFSAARELAADRCAAAVCGTGPLAGALLKVAEGPRFASGATVAAMGAGDLLDLRVLQME